MGPLRILGTTAALVALAALPAAAGTSAPLRTTANTATFEDSTGEQADAPDISRVVVSNDNTGLITFRINIPNRATLSEDMLVNIDVDADNNASTGDPEALGADYSIQLFQSRIDLFRWDGEAFTRSATDPPQASLVFSYAGGPTIKISAAELGNTTRLRFGVLVISGIKIDQNGDPDFTAARGDLGPDPGHGLWAYQVNTAPLRLLARKFTAGTPRAGAVYTLRLVAARNDTGAQVASGQVTCKASVGGRALTATTRRFVNKEARCSWVIPSSARGQSLRASIRIVHEGKSLTRSVTRRVG